MTSPFLVPPGEGPTVTALGSTYRTQTDGREVRAAYSLMEEEFWSDSTPIHRHVDAEESFYVLDGEVELWVDGTVSGAGPGTFIVVPPGVDHGLRRLSDEPVRMLTLVSPPGFERIFVAVAEEGEDSLLAEPERLVALAAQYGTEIVGDYPASS